MWTKISRPSLLSYTIDHMQEERDLGVWDKAGIVKLLGTVRAAVVSIAA
jgi:hypothetical protein